MSKEQLHSERVDLPRLDWENPKTVDDIIEGIKNPEIKDRLANLHADLIGVEQEINDTTHDAVAEIAKEHDLPPYLLEKLRDARTAEEIENGLEEWVKKEHAEGMGMLREFLAKNNKPQNLFHLNQDMSEEMLLERYALLDGLYGIFQDTPMSDRGRVEEAINRMFDIQTIPSELEEYLQRVADDEATVHSEGAENRNIIYVGDNFSPEVVKQSKGRHDMDYTSILKLMREMHAFSLHFNHAHQSENIKIHAAFEDMSVYLDRDGNYKRMVKQEYAPGQSMNTISDDVKNTEKFQVAWREFLQYSEEMKERFGVVMDISDSSAGFKKERGNVSKTGNVFVKMPTSEDSRYHFHIIDPDVFDTEPGVHKFDPKEQVRKKPGLGGLLSAAKVWATNMARDSIVIKWQDYFVKENLSKENK